MIHVLSVTLCSVCPCPSLSHPSPALLSPTSVSPPFISLSSCPSVPLVSPCALSSAGFLIGGDVLRLLHGHMDECLTVPSGEHGDEQRR